ncbi:ethylbenzene dehydrogenase-related protein [Skeletonema marinoi]|uniref:Ethylbenzene dehydrogenase-related protein n=1 Tax=Skeletonema marinoi TaxID=267567 RepID=A0AAD8XSP2_9STRA|nr:ethylbenzene dehydrogenase-related protein [Skeletonema marinoi]
MIFPKTKSAAFSLALSIAAFETLPTITAEDSCTSIDYITCIKTASPPTLDASFISDWGGVEVFESPLTGALTSKMYTAGNMKIQCVYDATDIYFLYQIPGKYMFDINDNKKFPEACAPYAVDIGAHWELKTTERGVMYGPNEGTGNDLIANKDDEFAVGPYCRVDDNFGTSPGNEWSGAWDFTGNATNANGAEGYYIFETSRSLTTPSPETDAQLTPGTEVNFGVSFWDPFETASGWTDAGHVVTGCSEDWIGLRLVDENGAATPVFDHVGGDEESAEPMESGTDGMETTSTSTPAPSGAASIIAGTAFTFVAAVFATCVVFEAISIV